jgi:hypothetical protein
VKERVPEFDCGRAWFVRIPSCVDPLPNRSVSGQCSRFLDREFAYGPRIFENPKFGLVCNVLTYERQPNPTGVSMSFFRTSIRSSSQKSTPQTFAGDQVILRWSGSQVGFATVLAWDSDGMRIRYHLPLQQSEIVKVIAPNWVLNTHVSWLCSVDGINEARLTLEPGRTLPTN